MNLDSRIDELYGLPLGEFTASRNTLAKTLSGDEAKRVRALTKPKLVPWTANQLFWKARAVFDRLAKSGASLREAQIATLKGRSADIRRAAEAHRVALADAVGRAIELASAQGANPDAGEVARMLEALSLSGNRDVRPGRWTEAVQPAGFEALSGVQPVAPAKQQAGAAHAVQSSSKADASHAAARQRDAEREEARRLEKERQRLAAAVQSAEQTVAEAKAREDRAREALDRATEDRHAAEALLASARTAVKRHV